MRMSDERLKEIASASKNVLFIDVQQELLQALKAEKAVSKALLQDNRRWKAKLDAIETAIKAHRRTGSCTHRGRS
jgi:hypothetical protein